MEDQDTAANAVAATLGIVMACLRYPFGEACLSLLHRAWCIRPGASAGE